MANSGKYAKPTCWSCRQQGHKESNCGGVDQRVCYRCKKIGHTAAGCRKRAKEHWRRQLQSWTSPSMSLIMTPPSPSISWIMTPPLSRGNSRPDTPLASTTPNQPPASASFLELTTANNMAALPSGEVPSLSSLDESASNDESDGDEITLEADEIRALLQEIDQATRTPNRLLGQAPHSTADVTVPNDVNAAEPCLIAETTQAITALQAANRNSIAGSDGSCPETVDTKATAAASPSSAYDFTSWWSQCSCIICLSQLESH